MKRNYNKSQLQAITHGVGPCLTLAGPGSGKTAVITERVKYLMLPDRVFMSYILRSSCPKMGVFYFCCLYFTTPR